MGKYKINFLLRTDKVNLNGESPVILTLSISNQLRKLNTGISLLPKLWDAKNKCAIYLNKKQAKELLPAFDFEKLPYADEIKKLNSDLLKLKLEIEDLINLYEVQKRPYSSSEILDDYRASNSSLARKEESSTFVFDYIDKYIEEFSPSRVQGSMSVYKALKSHLKAYQESKKTKIRFSNMDYDFFQSFQNFLFEHITDKGRTLNNITIAKQLSTLKTFLGYAKRSGIQVNSGFKDFVIKRQKLEVIALSEREFFKVYHFDLSNNPRLDRVRDVFCFSCMVGYRYSDLEQLRRYHIKDDVILLTTKKTKKPIETPINKIAKSILNKYANDEKPIPVISNQKYNQYLTELFKLIELNDEIEIVRFRGSERIVKVFPKWSLITAHSGRKSFASMLLEKGVQPQIIMELGGWTDFKSFQRYIKVNKKTMRNAVLNAWG